MVALLNREYAAGALGVNTVKIGDRLEDQLHEYLVEQSRSGGRVFDLYPPELCEIRPKAKYYCPLRRGLVEFDVVIEIRRPGRSEPHSYIVFECKNHKSALKDTVVTHFASQLRSVFGQSAKGILVISGRLQSGAEATARSLRLGIVKFDPHGLNIIADRTTGRWTESGFIESQFFETARKAKSLKFAGVLDGVYFATPHSLLQKLEAESVADTSTMYHGSANREVPFLTRDEIKVVALHELYQIGYQDGSVDVEAVCERLGLELQFLDQRHHDLDGNLILGTADFQNCLITVHRHENKFRERFTIAHEIGHFCLSHDDYLQSESLIEADLMSSGEGPPTFNYDRLEYQANAFAAYLLLPEWVFRKTIGFVREQVGIVDRGFGHIYVDDQPCNYRQYGDFLEILSRYFQVSKMAIEIGLKRELLLVDQRSSTLTCSGNALDGWSKAGNLPKNPRGYTQ